MNTVKIFNYCIATLWQGRTLLRVFGVKTMEKRYYRAKEIAVYLGVTITTVWNYAREGRLTPKKLSAHATVFDIREVNKLFDEVA
jgi:transcriptional regulator with XRE-family HTH domain